MHALEKILARAAGRSAVASGDMVTAQVDLAEVNDLYLQVLKSFAEMGGGPVWDSERIVFVFDHYSPAPTIRSAEIHRQMREFVRAKGVRHLFDVNRGVCHQVMPEAGLICPGMLLVATDSHTTTHGAFGAFGTGVGATDMAAVLKTGKIWLQVPEVIKIDLTGELSPGVMAKDIVLRILGELGTDFAAYQAVEYAGKTVERLPLAERMVLCNMAVEMGAKAAYIQPNDEVLRYVGERLARSGEPLAAKGFGRGDGGDIEDLYTDPDYHYAATYSFEVTGLRPQVALPHRVDQVMAVKEKEGISIDQAFVGTCTGGRLEDIAVVARILAGHHIAPNIRLVVTPASSDVLQRAIDEGYVQELLEAGATFGTPGCGPCLGAHGGVLAPGERCVTTSSRNFPGRMGSPEGEVYVVSPATAAWTALRGWLSNGEE
ncbi:MAG: 3-isopropylmalate dehydratase large subunit [Firmicutes bacterium]|nr:3-isopropylmalate dehydratase large subunit [Bacillota bacterium]